MRGTKPQLFEDDSPMEEFFPAPEWLSDDARKEWDRVLPVLLERRILTDADLGSLENYCAAIGQVREAQREINKRGILISNPRGTKKNPAVTVQSDAMTRARLLAAELGLTPVSRSRPAVRGSSGGEGDDPLNIP